MLTECPSNISYGSLTQAIYPSPARARFVTLQSLAFNEKSDHFGSCIRSWRTSPEKSCEVRGCRPTYARVPHLDLKPSKIRTTGLSAAMHVTNDDAILNDVCRTAPNRRA